MTQVTILAGEDEEQGEHSPIAGGELEQSKWKSIGCNVRKLVITGQW